MPAADTSPPSKACTLRVVRNAPLCREHLRLTLAVAGFPTAHPGQFVHVGPHVGVGQSNGQPTKADDGVEPPRPFLRRAMSIGGLRRIAGQCEIDLIYRVVGAGTRWMSSLGVGDLVDGIGPLGNAFPRLPRASTAYLVAGGVGLPPLLWLAQELHEAEQAAVLFLGVRSGDLIPLDVAHQDGQSVAREVPHTQLVLASDDGSIGFAGTVVEALEAYAANSSPRPHDATVYTCGPEVMMRAVARYCAGQSMRCYVCTERAMACGIGTCQSCVVPISDAGSPDEWRYALCCTDGPVFDASVVLWDSPAD
ncbi:MAG: dihydroorotate dehydrogenase electron transfer subunit [Planctomycetota bacterium]